jgi:hypothetical protein
MLNLLMHDVTSRLLMVKWVDSIERYGSRAEYIEEKGFKLAFRKVILKSVSRGWELLMIGSNPERLF